MSALHGICVCVCVPLIQDGNVLNLLIKLFMEYTTIRWRSKFMDRPKKCTAGFHALNKQSFIFKIRSIHFFSIETKPTLNSQNACLAKYLQLLRSISEWKWICKFEGSSKKKINRKMCWNYFPLNYYLHRNCVLLKIGLKSL